MKFLFFNLAILFLFHVPEGIFFENKNQNELFLGENEAICTYLEFADGKNRGLYDINTQSKGFPDEDYDATTTMVINWHRLPERNPDLDALLKFRMVYPYTSSWNFKKGETFEFWYRQEKINRVILYNLKPNSVYEYCVKENGIKFHFQTMPSSLNQRSVRIASAGDHQKFPWTDIAHANSKLMGLQQPDMFLSFGDLVSCDGEVTPESAERWATYFKNLYDSQKGYFIIDKKIGRVTFSNFVIPHVSILGNHELSKPPPIQEPNKQKKDIQKYRKYIAANWMELLFHWPFRSEGFRNELYWEHPNLDPEYIQEGFGHGGFGALTFSDYLLLIGLDNVLNWEGEPYKGFKDWTNGENITEIWPWYEKRHAEVRQDTWLKELLYPNDSPKAGEVFTHILPVWHRGFFGTVRQNMDVMNRDILKYWLPALYDNNVKLIIEGHDHCYTRTVPAGIYNKQPKNSYMEKVYLNPSKFSVPNELSNDYLTRFYSVNCIRDSLSSEVLGWEYEGNFIEYSPSGMIAVGHGGWAANRREIGSFNDGRTGLWHVNKNLGGKTFSGNEAYYFLIIELTNHELIVDSFNPEQLPDFENGTPSPPFSRFKWNKKDLCWEKYSFKNTKWMQYENEN